MGKRRIDLNGGHSIIVTHRGAIGFTGHPEGIKGELAIAALGGDCCYCIKILLAWREALSPARSILTVGKLPFYLRTLLYQIDELQRQRAAYKSITDPLTLPLRERIEWMVRPLAEQAIHACRYRRTAPHMDVGGKYVVNVRFGEPWICGYIEREQAEFGDWWGKNAVIDVTINPVHWYLKIYKRGLAVVDGCFVLAHRGDDRYLVGRQSRGFDVKPWEARIVLGDDGKPHIVKWIRPAEIVLDENGKPHVK